MESDKLFGIAPEQTIYEWVDEVLAPIDDVIYDISKQVNTVMRGVLLYVY